MFNVIFWKTSHRSNSTLHVPLLLRPSCLTSLYIMSSLHERAFLCAFSILYLDQVLPVVDHRSIPIAADVTASLAASLHTGTHIKTWRFTRIFNSCIPISSPVHSHILSSGPGPSTPFFLSYNPFRPNRMPMLYVMFMTVPTMKHLVFFIKKKIPWQLVSIMSKISTF